MTDPAFSTDSTLLAQALAALEDRSEPSGRTLPTAIPALPTEFSKKRRRLVNDSLVRTVLGIGPEVNCEKLDRGCWADLFAFRTGEAVGGLFRKRVRRLGKVDVRKRFPMSSPNQVLFAQFCAAQWVSPHSCGDIVAALAQGDRVLWWQGILV